jgi:hypothetical protein
MILYPDYSSILTCLKESVYSHVIQDKMDIEYEFYQGHVRLGTVVVYELVY